MNKICLSASAAALVVTASVVSSFAAELPSYEVRGLPISQVQLRVLGAENVRERLPMPASTLTPVQFSVLTPRARTTAAAPTVGAVR